MKIKFTLLLLTMFAGASTISAQSSVDCVTTGSIFTENAKVKNYDAAYEPFRKLMENCPKWSYALYQYGERLYRDRLEKAPEEEKKAVVAEFIQMYEQKYASYPDRVSKGENLTDIAQLMSDNNVGTKMEQFQKFNEAWEADKDSFTSPRALYNYFVLGVELQSTGDMDLNEIFVLYDDVQEKITEEQNAAAESAAPLLEKEEAGTALTQKEERAKNAANANLENYSKVIAGMNEKLGKLADCDNLIPLYQKDFDAKKDDIDWIRRAAGRMSSKECTEDPFFEKLVVQLDKLEPSAQTAYYLGQLADKNGDNTKAVKYYEESANRETDPSKKAVVFMRLGEKMRARKSYSQARSFYQKSLEAKPSNGRAYLMIANMYASSANSCGETQFEKRAIYWLAADYASRAAKIDPSISSNANETAASYRGLAPSKTEIFQSGKAGQKINFSCWIGGGVTVPNP
ncbi:tetratricopeptide repeat protein [Flavimarina sp. Hel_I_48]|uniref:tetratricopeptide repeat protein n=1 Tax=Flavimarina sp. Hel_I_48 TaxID=1392488 RepID=UPI0004DF4B3F|nr:hypothetical protein [Flavimarina sp. Hel_I_48]